MEENAPIRGDAGNDNHRRFSRWLGQAPRDVLLSDAMATAILMDVPRDGMTAVLRDRFGQFVPLDLDFSHREGVLLDRYQQALAALDEYSPTP
jgi:hypothetical protein